MTIKLQPWMVVLTTTIAIVLLVVTWGRYGLVAALGCAFCLVLGWILGALIIHEVDQLRSATAIVALVKQIGERDTALHAANARIAELEEESAARLAQGESANERAEAHLAEVKALRAGVAHG